LDGWARKGPENKETKDFKLEEGYHYSSNLTFKAGLPKFLKVKGGFLYGKTTLFSFPSGFLKRPEGLSLGVLKAPGRTIGANFFLFPFLGKIGKFTTH